MSRRTGGARSLHALSPPNDYNEGPTMLTPVRAPSPAAFIPSRIAALTGGARVDACFVGGGLAGMIAAYLLAREKRVTMVVDEGPVAGARDAESVHLSSMIEQPYHELERLHGELSARL